MYIYIYICMCVYIYIYIYNPPLIVTPLIKNKPWGDKLYLTISLDGGTITPS